MDEQRRRLERRAAGGDPEARARVEHNRCRRGECCAHRNAGPVEGLTIKVARSGTRVDVEFNNEAGVVLVLPERGTGYTTYQGDRDVRPFNETDHETIVRVCAALGLPDPRDCPRCDATGNSPCTTPSGNRAKHPHRVRPTHPHRPRGIDTGGLRTPRRRCAESGCRRVEHRLRYCRGHQHLQPVCSEDGCGRPAIHPNDDPLRCDVHMMPW